MFQIVLHEPEIPANTGAIGRTCVATHTPLHLVGQLGFSLEDKYLKRAGLDYWKDVNLKVYDHWASFLEQNPGANLILFSKKAQIKYSHFAFQGNEYLVFGKETKGLPHEILESGYPLLKIPTPGPVRSLNLSVAAGIALYEGIRQIDSTP